MWLSRTFNYEGHVLNFLNKNKELISNVSVSRCFGEEFIVFFYTYAPELLKE